MDKIGICNMAIGFVGGNSIMSFADKTLEADQCELNYDIAREFCLESRDWTFAAAYKKLAIGVAVSPAEFANNFPLPSDCLVVRAVSDNEDLRSAITYQIDGNTLVTDSATAYIKYTKNVVDTSLSSPSFQIAVSHKLGELIASVISGDKVLKRTLMGESDVLLEGGGAINGMQGSPKRAFASRLLGARYRSGRNIIGKYTY